MSRVVVSREKIVAIADAVREKTGGTEALTLDGVADAIAGIVGEEEVKRLKDEVDGIIEKTLTKFENHRVTKIGGRVFFGALSLAEVYCQRVTVIGDYAFSSCTGLKKATFPSATVISTNAFGSCTSMSALILSGNTVCRLANVSGFNLSSVANGTGFVYVPATLVDQYKAATNWTVYADQIRAIEDYPEIVGG